MAELGERAFARIADATVVKQADAAVRAKINRRVFQVHWAFAARAHAFGQPRQRGVVTEFFAALRVGKLLGEFLLFKVTVQRNNRLPPDSTVMTMPTM